MMLMQEAPAHVAIPLYQQFLLDLCAPPIMTCLWWLMSRGWARTIQGSDVSEQTKHRQSKGFWIVLGSGYLIMFGGTIYFNSLK